MFNLDEKFLESVGLQDMPEGERAEFLRGVQEDIEDRVGEKMSEGMTEAQIAEFERIANGDEGAVGRILMADGDYREDPLYRKMVDEGGLVDRAAETLAEYASVKWMMKNKPNYREIVDSVMAEVRREIEENREKLLGGE